jgi:hypothetical protein
MAWLHYQGWSTGRSPAHKPGRIMVHQKAVTLSAERQEETAFRFTLTRDGNVMDINELPKPFVGRTDLKHLCKR